ncbi:MAG: hypothetical protein AAB463_01165 [Patescibacteria group bacterium]
MDIYKGADRIRKATTLQATFDATGQSATAHLTFTRDMWEALAPDAYNESTGSMALQAVARINISERISESVLLLFSMPALAETPSPSGSPPPPVTTDKTLGGMIAQVYEWAILLLGAIMFFIIVKSGFTILMNADNPNAVTKARSDIQDVFVGALFLLAAYAILNTINPDLVNFQQNLPPLPTPAPRS